ncbi:hypothetical protein PG985_010429 [Apiospora marii]|uniref:uncharacterized protein n=1 Tax=Apiospora marii TaxID=335849 RepID=UPI00313226C4
MRWPSLQPPSQTPFDQTRRQPASKYIDGHHYDTMMSYDDVNEKPQHEDGVACINRGKKNTTIRAVKNVWHERACAHVRHYKRFYIAFSIILVLAVTATALAPSMIQMHRQHGGGTKNQDPPSLVPIVTIPIPTTSSQAPSATCMASGFTANASFVGVYNPAVNAPQLIIVAARSAADCCRRCFAFAQQPLAPALPARHCNGWGFINSLCSVVYDYPGEGANGTCPKGYPSVQISGGQGGDRDFAGRGPCALGGGLNQEKGEFSRGCKVGLGRITRNGISE